MERIKSQKSIGRVFAFYIISFCIVTILLMVSNFGLFGYMISKEVILPANYYEKYIEENRKYIAETKNVQSIIPEECSYAVYTLEGNMIQGNMDKKKVLDVWNLIKNNKKSNGSYFYKSIKREKEICIIEYTIMAKFSNPILRKYVPSAEYCFMVSAIILFVLEVIVFSRCFKRRLIKEIKILKYTTENIQMENLDFKIEYSNIIEINEVLSALDKMKVELHKSLNNQWRMEEIRKDQVAALAHDIRTPLTIIRGNGELLEESNLSKDKNNLVKNILGESNKMEFYIKSLVEIMKSEKEIKLNKENIDLNKFIKDIIEMGNSITLSKGIQFISKVSSVPEVFLADKMALYRATINVISNAVEHTPLNGKILFNVYVSDKYIDFIIEDSGSGFNKEELKYATEQFFQGDKSRSSKNHYGMGLYIAREFINKHNGNIILENSIKFGGAKVILEIPV